MTVLANSQRAAKQHPNAFEALFAPRSVAIIGASDDPQKVGGRPVRYLRRHGWPGRIYPVNPSRQSIQGLPAFGSVLDVGDDIDVAIVAVPAPHVPAALAECARGNVKVAVTFSGGFAETGEAGAAAQAELSRQAGGHSMRVVGPNCLGVASAASGAVLSFSPVFEDHGLDGGPVAIVSQSGSVGTFILKVLRQAGVGVSYFVATGNEMDVTAAEAIREISAASDAGVIAAYIEGSADAGELESALTVAAERGKRVVVLQGALSARGIRASSRHTALPPVARLGGLASEVEIAEDLQGFTDLAIRKAHEAERAQAPRGDGRALGVVSSSGGIGILLSDYASGLGFSLPEPPRAVQDAITAMVPLGTAFNPFDVTAQWVTERDLIGRVLERLLPLRLYDSFVLFLGNAGSSGPTTERVIGTLAAIVHQHPQIPIVLSTFVTPATQAMFDEAGLIVTSEPLASVARAAGLLAAPAKRGQRQP